MPHEWTRYECGGPLNRGVAPNTHAAVTLNFPRNPLAVRSHYYQGVGEGWRVLRRYPESYEDEGKPQNAGAEVLSIRRTRRKEILLVLRKGCDISIFEKALDQAVGEKAEVKSLV